jgi:hypothetical protein
VAIGLPVTYPTMLAAILAITLLAPQDNVDTYGKTQAEVLAMGPDAWFKFYTAQAGDSTAAMSNAYGIYGDIAAARNKRMLSSSHLKDRSKLEKLRSLMANFGGDMINLGSLLSGGGTMWNVVSAQQYADAEETFYSVARPSGRAKAKQVVVSDVTKRMELNRKKVLASLASGDIPKDKKGDAMSGLADAKSTFREIVAIASTYDRTTSDRILGFCLRQAELLGSL